MNTQRKLNLTVGGVQQEKMKKIKMLELRKTNFCVIEI